jgi:hypothetical protein
VSELQCVAWRGNEKVKERLQRNLADFREKIFRASRFLTPGNQRLVHIERFPISLKRLHETCLNRDWILFVLQFEARSI